MPELPEVEAVCRLMRDVLVDRILADVVVADDPIVLGGARPSEFRAALVGRTVAGIGRHGKFWWIELDKPPALMGHLGMSGWIRELGAGGVRLRSHGDRPLDENGAPRFAKLVMTTDIGRRVAFTDGRRLGRLWLAESPRRDPRIASLGPDAFDQLPDVASLQDALSPRKAPIKSLLLNQTFLAGIGNWVADEVLYHARIAPARSASSLDEGEMLRLRNSISTVLQVAVEADADYTRFPPDWLFHHRWGGGRGVERIGNHKIVRETIGGRTTAWSPEVQR